MLNRFPDALFLVAAPHKAVFPTSSLSQPHRCTVKVSEHPLHRSLWMKTQTLTALITKWPFPAAEGGGQAQGKWAWEKCNNYIISCSAFTMKKWRAFTAGWSHWVEWDCCVWGLWRLCWKFVLLSSSSEQQKEYSVEGVSIQPLLFVWKYFNKTHFYYIICFHHNYFKIVI